MSYEAQSERMLLARIPFLFPRTTATSQRRATSVSAESDARWYVCCSAAALGERGTSGAAIDLLKFGIPTSRGAEPPLPYSDEQLGFGRAKARGGHVDRWRRCHCIYWTISPGAREAIWLRFDPRQWGPGVAGAFGELAGVVALILARSRGDGWSTELDRVAQSLGRDAALRRSQLHAQAQKLVASALGEWDDVVRLRSSEWAGGGA